MIRLSIIVALSLAIAWTLCYGAMRTAQAIADASRLKLERVMLP